MRKHRARDHRSALRSLVSGLGFVAAIVSLSPLGARNGISMPGPAPQVRSRDVADVAAMNARCESCHADIAAEWQRSFHRTAFTDPAFQRAFAIEPLPFCQGCHAPEANPAAPVPSALGALGVGCVTCHWTGQEVLAAPRPGTSNEHLDAHDIVRDLRFGGAAACASCHEFAFPDRGKRTTPELMQSTVTEHAASANADRSCADCHMPLVTDKLGGKRHRSHQFEASRSVAMVRRAVTVTAVRNRPTSIQITLEPTWAGHAFPTGDLFRRVEVHVEALGVDYQAVVAQTRYLMRHFAEKKHGVGIVRYVAFDDRLHKTPMVLDLDLGPKAAALPIAYRIAYQRVEHPRSERPEDSVIEGEIVLSEGILQPTGNTP